MTAAAGSKAHILVVEDHVQLRNVLHQALHAEGFRITLAASGDDALPLLENSPVDMLLSDVRMSGSVDGLRLAQWVRQHRPSTAVLLMTGFYRGDMDGFRVLHKPFTPEQLITCIQESLSLRTST